MFADPTNPALFSSAAQMIYSGGITSNLPPILIAFQIYAILLLDKTKPSYVINR